MREGERGNISCHNQNPPTNPPDKAMNDERSLNHVYFEWHNIKCATTSICFDESVTNFQLFTF